MAADTNTETKSLPQTEHNEQPEQTSPTSETNPTPTTETQPTYQSRADHIKELNEYKESEESNELGAGSSDTIAPHGYSDAGGYVDASYQSRADHIKELNEYKENEESNGLGAGFSDAATPREYGDSGGYVDTGVDHSLEDQSPSKYQQDLANRGDYIGDADRIIDNERPLKDSLDETDSGVDSRLVPESSSGDSSEAEPRGDTYHDAGDIKPLAAAGTRSSNNNGLGNANHVLDKEQPADNNNLTTQLNSQRTSPETVDKTNSNPTADEIREPPSLLDDQPMNSPESTDKIGRDSELEELKLLADQQPNKIPPDQQLAENITTENSQIDEDLPSVEAGQLDEKTVEIQEITPVGAEPCGADREGSEFSGVTQESTAGLLPYPGDLPEKPEIRDAGLQESLQRTHHINLEPSGKQDIGVMRPAHVLPDAPPGYEVTPQIKPVLPQPVELTDTERSPASGTPSISNENFGNRHDISNENPSPEDLSHNTDGDAALKQGQYPPGAAERMLSNEKPLPVLHNDAQVKSHVSSPEIANGPASPPTSLASGTGQETHLVTVANQALPETAASTHNRTATQELVDQPQGSTVEIHQAPPAELDDAPHPPQPKHNDAEQSEPAANQTVNNTLDDSNTVPSTSESEISDSSRSTPVSTEIDNSVENDSDTRNDTQDTVDAANNDEIIGDADEQPAPESDPESALPGQLVQFDSAKAAEEDHPVDATDTILRQDDSTQVADTFEESAESATENPLEQTRGDGNALAEDDENSAEDEDDTIRSSTDATADESDPDSQLNNDLERPENPRVTAVEEGARHTCGDPIDIATGEVVMHQTDVELPGALPLILTRTHISSYRAGQWFGRCWASTLSQRLKIDEDGACYAAADGMLLVYPPVAGGMPVLPQEGPRWPLTHTEEGTYTITDPQLGHTLHFTSVISGDPVLPLTAITDRNQHRIDLDYHPNGTLTEIRHSGGYRITVDTTHQQITALHLLDPITGTTQTLIRYSYDSDDRLTEVINSSGLPLRFDYDTHGRMTTWQDRNGTWYRYTYNETGRCIRTTGSKGYMNATLAYDLDNRITVVTDSLGHVTTFCLNELGQVIREINPLGNATTSEWDRYDRLLTRTDPLERTTRYTYDPAGNLITVTRPDGSHTNAIYNDLRLPTSIIDYDGATWLRDYDQRGNLTTINNPLGATTNYTHNKHGHLTTITDALGNTHRIDTNPAGLPIMITTPRGGTTHYERDAFGRVVAITDPGGGSTRFGWTIEGKPAWRIQPDGASERWTYDSEGNLTEHLNPAGMLTRTQYTHFDLPAAQIGPDGARLEFSYDTELRLTSVINPQGLVWRYDYDPAGNLIRETDFNDRILTYTHDAAGHFIERTNGAGETTHYHRDLVGNIIEQRAGDTVATFTYDGAGRIVRATNADADLTFQRDPLGQVVAETCNGRTLTSTYNFLGHRIRRRTPSGAESTWEYDTNNQPIALHTAGRTLRFSYDPAGRETQRHLGNNILLTQTWDANDHLLSQTLTAGSPDPKRPQSARQARLIHRRSYTYRPDGYLTSVDDHLNGARRFDLDPNGRITAVHGSGWTERYAYDPAGNITHATWPAPSQTGPPDTDVRGERSYAGTLIRRAGNIRYQHDTQGRVIIRRQKRLSVKPRTWRYIWNTNDQLTAVTTPDDTHWRYHYDPLGRRIAKQRLGEDNATVVEQVDFIWDGPVLAEQIHTHWRSENSKSAGSHTTTWNWQPNTFRPISQTERTKLRDAPQEWIDQKFYAIITDLIGTPTELINDQGGIAWHPHATLWGATHISGPGDADCPLRFPGQYHDTETQLHNNYHRYYDPTTARYESNDVLGLSAGLNPHTYVSNPTAWLDPLGLFSCLDADLEDWCSVRYQFDNEWFILDKKDIKHILGRHHPAYWNGVSKEKQTFFDKDMSITDVVDKISQVMRQNRDALILCGTNRIRQVQGVVDSREYTLGIKRGHVNQFFPK